MPKDESSGLLSKVVKFVRNPGGGWAEGGEESGDESSYSKQMLKEMIERKRRNDFVRKREFDMLRKMRRSEVMAGQDPAARPSFFQSSMPSKPDDRASTLKKIDEIEAQMSMQWWKTKHGDVPRTGAGAFTASGLPPDSTPRSVPGTIGGPGGLPIAGTRSYVKTEPQPLAPSPAPADDVTMEAPLLDFTNPLNMSPAQSPAAPAPAAAAPAQAPAPAVVKAVPTAAPAPAPVASMLRGAMNMLSGAADRAGTPSGFSPSKLVAMEVDEFAHDPELEEAAIRFANGDDDGAEAGLMEVLGPGGARIDHDETWLTLFDLYRATGRQERFESTAIEFAGRFGRSAPQWISLPEVVGKMGAAPAAATPGGNNVADWTSPATLGTQTVATLNAALARAAQPWRLSWAKLTAIEEGALDSLARLFAQWSAQPVQLRFIGADNLERVLRVATTSGDKGVNPSWWKLRMEVLRVMHRPDEFELVALDYCVTYEVSPPSWDSARCEYKPLQADGTAVAGHTIIGEAFRDSMTSNITGYGDTMTAGLSSQMANVVSVELAGQILGDAKEALDMLDGKVAGADVMVISCARLIRIDFTAAGTLLNWVSARQGEGRQVQFQDVHRLVAAFFNVIGISEHSRVIARRD